MDITILYVIIIVVVAIGLIVLGKFLREKNLVSTDDLIFAMKTLQLSADIVSQLNLQHEDKIKTVAEIVAESIDYVNKNIQGEEDKIVLATDYSYKLCEKMGVELTDERKSIIKQLIELSLTEK